MFTLTYDGATVTLYIDSVNRGTAAYSGYFSTAADSFTIGNGGTKDPTSFYAGKADEVGVWSRALSASEVAQLYSGGLGLSYPFLPPSTTPQPPAPTTPTFARTTTYTYDAVGNLVKKSVSTATNY